MISTDRERKPSRPGECVGLATEIAGNCEPGATSRRAGPVARRGGLRFEGEQQQTGADHEEFRDVSQRRAFLRARLSECCSHPAASIPWRRIGLTAHRSYRFASASLLAPCTTDRRARSGRRRGRAGAGDRQQRQTVAVLTMFITASATTRSPVDSRARARRVEQRRGEYRGQRRENPWEDRILLITPFCGDSEMAT